MPAQARQLQFQRYQCVSTKPVPGRFLYFKNPFKYAGGFNLNHKAVHPAASRPLTDHIFTCHFNGLFDH